MKKYLLLLFLVSPLFAQMRLIPHVTRSQSDFETWIIVENPTAETQGFQIDKFTQDGNFLPYILDQLAPGETKMWAADLLLGSEFASHFVLGGQFIPSEAVRVSISYSRKDGTGSPAYVHQSSVEATKWRIYAGDWTKVYDSMAIVNTSEQTARIVLRHLALDGTLLQENILAEAAAPMSKTLSVLSAAEPAFDRNASPVFEIVADQPVQVLALQGDHQSVYMWQNTAIPNE